MDARLLFGIAIGIVSLCLRWRFPAVPKPIATFGIIAGVGVAVWSLSAIPVGLAISVILNFALIGVLADNLWSSRVRSLPTDAGNSSQRTAILRQARRQLQGAAYTANWDGFDHGPHQAAKDFAVLQSAFATARKIFGLNTPQLAGASVKSLAVGVDFLNQVQPFIDAGHLDDAKAAADAFIQQLQ